MRLFSAADAALVGRLNAEIAGLEADVTRLAAWLADERADKARLIDRLLSLKMAGAVEPPIPALIPGILPFTPRDELLDLIDAKAATNYRLRAIMLKQLATDRAAKVDDDTIRERIETGVEGNGVPA